MEQHNDKKTGNTRKSSNDMNSGPLLRKVYMRLPINTSLMTGWRYPHLPRLKGNAILGRIPHLMRENGILDNLVAAGNLAKEHPSGMCYYWLGHKLVLLITRPEHIRELLIDHNKDIERGSSFSMFRKFMGSNITVDEHDKWKLKQEIYSEWVSHSAVLTEHEPRMINIVNKYVSLIGCKQEELLDLRSIFNRYALEILLTTVLLPNGYSEVNVTNLLKYHSFVTKEVFEYKNIFKWMFPVFLRKIIFKESPTSIKETCAYMRQYLDDQFLKPNENTLKYGKNFVNSIYNLSTHHEKDELISDENVFGDTSMMFLAGQDTNLATFQFAVKLLSANPQIEATLRNDLQLHLQHNTFTMEQINKVEFLDKVVKETLRMFPPVMLLPRDVASPFSLGGVPLKKGDIVMFSPYLTHHLEEVWEKHSIFNPERFSQKNKITPHSYLPFGLGAHSCIGQKFALQEIKLLLAAIYLKYSLDITNNSFDISLAQGALKPKLDPLAVARKI